MMRRAKNEAKKQEVRDKVECFVRANPDLRHWDDLYRRYVAEGHRGISPETFFILIAKEGGGNNASKGG